MKQIFTTDADGYYVLTLTDTSEVPPREGIRVICSGLKPNSAYGVLLGPEYIAQIHEPDDPGGRRDGGGTQGSGGKGEPGKR